MGWLFGYRQSRAELVERRTTGNAANGETCLRYCTVGNVLWTVWEIRRNDEPVQHYIGCDLLARDGDTWGYKAMCESMGPNYFSCPLVYLEMVPVADEAWREQVRAWHAARSRKADVGDVLVFSGLSIPRVTITGRCKRSFIGEYGGKAYRIPPRLMSRVIEHRRAGA